MMRAGTSRFILPVATSMSKLLNLLILLLLPLAAWAQPVTTIKPRQPAVASASADATGVGLEILAVGGNAFDAAVAVSATLGLVEPESSGLGGGGFFLLRSHDGRVVFIDARERAPAAASRDMYLDADGHAEHHKAINGPLSAAIPGLPAGLVHVAERYGRLSLAESLKPAIRLAREGWRFESKNRAMLDFKAGIMANNPGAASLFLPDGKPPQIGALMRNPDYADVLERLASKGADGFYRGAFAEHLVEGVRKAGGIWTVADLADYAVVEREPIRLHHRQFEIITAPPPSSGGVALVQIFNILDGYDYPAMDRDMRIHVQVEAMRRAYRDRAIYLGDPDHVTMPLEILMHPAYAAGLRASINLEQATPSWLLPGVGQYAERSGTSHFSVIDREGNLAAVTQTVNLPYGSGFVVPGTGFLLNNEMDDFSIKAGEPNAYGLIGEDANAIAPGRRPLSSMTPSFLISDERIAALGTPGGSRIITMMLIGLLELMDGVDAQAVADLPRYHHQYLPDEISMENDALDADTITALEARGHTVRMHDRSWGNMQVVVWKLTTGEVQVGSDSRWKGSGEGVFGKSLEKMDKNMIFR